jgi:hypothetical protein
LATDSTLAPDTSRPTLAYADQSEPLIRIDCQGEIRPGIAVQWASDSGGKIWTFVLASRRSASTVVSNWNAQNPGPKELGIDSAVAIGESTIRVALGPVRDSVPRLFADSVLALDGDTMSTINPRDALDRGADVVVTRDPAVAEYVAGRPDFMSFALPWNRTYVLLQPAGAEPVIGGLRLDSLTRSLATDVVPAEARPAEGPFWWQRTQGCLRSSSSGPSTPKLPRILYRRDDPAAAALAERIVALAQNAQLRAAGVSDSEFRAAYGDERYLGYIIALPRQVAAPCYRSSQLASGASIQPLIETRARAIIRRGSPPMAVDWDGGVRPIR